MAKSKYHLFGDFYCAELEAVSNEVKRNGILLEIWGCSDLHFNKKIFFFFIKISLFN
jgi:hypothetical protein